MKYSWFKKASATAVLSIISLSSVYAMGTEPPAPQPQYLATENITRLEFVVNIMNNKYGGKGTLPQKDCFIDVRATQWSSAQLCKAAETGVINGRADGYFRPNDLVTIREAMAMFQRVYEVNLDGMSFYEWPLSKAQAENLVPLTITDLDAPVTRGLVRQMKERIPQLKNPVPPTSKVPPLPVPPLQEQPLLPVSTLNPSGSLNSNTTGVSGVNAGANAEKNKTATPQAQYLPNETITRLEFVVNLMNSKYGGKGTLPQKDCFNDVKATDWNSAQICKASETGIISGYSDGSFRKDNNVTVREALVMFQRVYDVNLDGMSFYEWPLTKAQAMNLVPLNVTDMDMPITRGMMRQIKARVQALKAASK